MSTPSAAAIYGRISSDPDETRAGVGRQIADCRKLANSLGWTVTEEYVDNDLSAYSGKHRPEYERLLADLSDGRVDGVLVYDLDRLTRRPIELEHFADTLTAAKVEHVKFVTGDVNLFKSTGYRWPASEESSRRRNRRTSGVASGAIWGNSPRRDVFHGGANRPFGYARDGIAIVPEEAAIHRVLVGRLLAGESLRSLASWLNDEEVPTVTGVQWRTTTLRRVLCNPRYAALREHRGTVVGPAVWEPIITEEEHHRVLARFAEKKNSGRRTPQNYLLSGMLRCGECGNKLYSSRRENSRRYVCLKGPDHGGCGRLTVVADPVERLIADAVLYRLDTPDLADTLAGKGSADARTFALSMTLEDIKDRRMGLTDAYAAGDLKMDEWRRAKAPLEAQAEGIQRQLARLTSTSALSGLAGNGESLRRSWDTLNLSRQNAIVSAVVNHAVIGPGTAGARTLDPSRVNVVWRY